MPGYFVLLLLAAALLRAAAQGNDYRGIRTRSSDGQPVCDCRLFDESMIPQLKGEKGSAGATGESRRVITSSPTFKRHIIAIVSEYVGSRATQGVRGPKGEKGFAGDDQIGQKGEKGLSADCSQLETCKYGLPQNVVESKMHVVNDYAVAYDAALNLFKYGKETRCLFFVVVDNSSNEDPIYFYSHKYNGLRKLVMQAMQTRS